MAALAQLFWNRYKLENFKDSVFNCFIEYLVQSTKPKTIYICNNIQEKKLIIGQFYRISDRKNSINAFFVNDQHHAPVETESHVLFFAIYLGCTF